MSNNNNSQFSILLAIHEQSDPVLPFVHALSLASAVKGELEIIDVRKNRHNGPDLGVRKTFEQWRMLPAGSRREDVGKIGIKVKKIVRKGDSEKSIGKRLQAQEHDILVIGTEIKKGIAGLFGKDLAEHLAQSYRQTTLYIPKRGKPFVDPLSGKVALNKILVPVAVEPDVVPAINYANKIAKSFSSGSIEITGIHIGETFPAVSTFVTEGLNWTEKTTKSNGKSIADTIVNAAHEEKADLITMSTNGRDTFSQKIMGSITEQVVKSTPCPVLAVVVD